MTLPTGKRRRIAAFTLLEMLVAVVLLAFVVATLSSAFHGALAAYREGEDRGQLLAAGRGACYLLADDLRRQLPLRDPSCRFEAQQLAFVARTADGPPELVSWNLGDNVVRRGSSPWVDAGRRDGGSSSTVADGFAKGGFEYLLDDRWRDTLPTDGDRLPEAVRLRFQLQHQDESADFAGAWSCVRGPRPTPAKTPAPAGGGQ